jgi:ribose 5-phosphate isomerase A
MTDVAKRAAAVAAAALVQSGMVVGLGSGSTMRFAIEALAAKLRDEGLRFVGVPTSVAVAASARALGISLTELDGPVDLAIDGADEIERGTMRLIKGLGGALLREKIVVESSRRFVVVANSEKLVERLGTRAPVPVEVTRFGHLATARRLAALGAEAALRRGADRAPFVTDGGNFVYDCGFGAIGDPFTLELGLRGVAGVLCTGLFLGAVEQAFVGMDDGTVQVQRGH